jgi:hypothetical protein
LRCVALRCVASRGGGAEGRERGEEGPAALVGGVAQVEGDAGEVGAPLGLAWDRECQLCEAIDTVLRRSKMVKVEEEEKCVR